MLDALSGAVDFHNHLLPGIDDGCKTKTCSINMLELYSEAGIQKIISSPHIIYDLYPNNHQSILKAFHQVKEIAGEQAHLLHYPAAEYLMDEFFDDFLQEPHLMTIGQRHLLVEFSYFNLTERVDQQFFEITQRRLTPILAHPERYNYLSVDALEKYKKLGCKFQLNLLSLTGHYGANVKTKALKLLERNWFDLAATDAHKTEHLQKLRNYKISTNIYSSIKTLAENSLELI
ncbi:MAG: CpsB/CapC family capsule biosynthesis tyrosine phosphatase [Flavobacteriaceae bacterium]|nr:CpsB/CapC family capsule biosynthesis tyrosine phosphatase [Flavobacteriaceae bacterium]